MSQRRDARNSEEDSLQSHFPTLYKEIVEGEERIFEDEIRTTTGSKRVRKFKGYTPGVIDFICRCSTEEEAMEIIEYMLTKGDISEKHAKELKAQLQEKGLEFFGEHRAPGYYERA
jgi:hypothetical protein